MKKMKIIKIIKLIIKQTLPTKSQRATGDDEKATH